MPHIWEKTGALVVTQEELIPAWFPSYDALRMAIKRCEEKNHGIKRLQKGGGGHPMLIAYDSLPREIQNALGDPRKPGHLLEMFYQTDPAAVRFYTGPVFEDCGYLGQKHQEEYIINASVLQAANQLRIARENERRSRGGSLKGIMGTICADVASFKPILLQKFSEAHTLPDSEKRFKETFRGFFTQIDNPNGEGKILNYPSLISGKLRNSNSRLVTDDVVRLLNDLFAGQQHKPTRTEVSRCFDAFLSGYTEVVKSDGSGECYDPKDFRKLSDATIINYLGAWENKIGTFAKRSGDRQRLIGQFKPSHSLQQPSFAGSIISIDDRQPPFEYAPGSRPWFYNGIDLGSELFVCSVWGQSKEGIILDFYRKLVRTYTAWGFCLPAELEAEASLNSSYTGTFLRPGALFSHNVRIEANNARGKRIEAYYRQLRYGNEKSREGWLARPFARSEANQAGPQKVPVLPYNQIIQDCLRDIEDWNNSPHSKHPNKTRWEFFCETQHPDLKPTNWKAILPSLGYFTPTSCKAGIIELQKEEFLLGDNSKVATGEPLIELMKEVEGRSLDVYWLDGLDGKVMKAIVMLDGKCICEAVPKPVYNKATIEQTDADKEARTIMSKYVATIDAYMRQRKASISDVLLIGTPEKPLNRKFVMPGLAPRYVPDDAPAPALDDVPEDDWMPVAPQPSGGDYLRDF